MWDDLTYDSTLQVITGATKEDFLLLDLLLGTHLLLTAFGSETSAGRRGVEG